METFIGVVRSGAARQYYGPAPVAAPPQTTSPSPSSTGASSSQATSTSGIGPTTSGSLAATGLLPFQQYIAAHAIMCVLGFLVLLPAGAIIARWMRTSSQRWFKIHWIVQWALAMPIIITGFALGVTSVNKNDRLPVNDTHKKWGVTLFCLYLIQISLGSFIHFVKIPFFHVAKRSFQNFFHAVFGIFIIGASFYQVRTGFRTEWPLYTGLKVKNGANVVWIMWLVLVIIVYFGGLWLLPRQFRQEQAARDATERLELTSTTELVSKKRGQM